MKYIKILPAAGLVLTTAVSSCSFEQDDYFDDSAALRVEKFSQEVKETLCANDSNGWVFQYFLHGEGYQSGYNLFCRFYESEKVVIASNHKYLQKANTYTEATSLYEVTPNDGPLLEFNTWNDVLTVFVDPVNPSTGDKDGAGLGGDDNFMVMSCSDTELILRGQRRDGHMRLVKCDRPWKQYISDCETSDKYLFGGDVQAFYMVSGADTLCITGMDNHLFTIGERIVDPLNFTTMPIVMTPNGVRLEKTYTMGNNAAQEFTYATDSSFLVSEDGKMELIPAWQYYCYTQMTADQKIKFDTSSVALNSVVAELCTMLKSYYPTQVLQSITFTKPKSTDKMASGTSLALMFAVKAGSSTLRAAFEVSVKQDAVDQITITCNSGNYSATLATYKKKSEDLFNAFANVASTIVGTYHVHDVDNGYKPSSFVMTSTEKEIKVTL